jgi:hypothetical protein
VLRAAAIGALVAFAAALPAAARPYLMLDADGHGFQALDLGSVDRSQAGLAKATVIEAPLAGIEVDGKLAPLVERRVEIDCASPRWRVEQIAYVDGEERAMGKGEADAAWRPFAQDDVAATVQAAACRRQYRQQAVSRYLNIGEILANYQAAHARAKPEPPTAKELRDRQFRNGH